MKARAKKQQQQQTEFWVRDRALQETLSKSLYSYSAYLYPAAGV